jgi:PKD repeat protein
MDASGDATAVWHNASTGTQRYALHPHNGSFGGTFDGPAGTLAPVAAADAAGHVHAAWPLGSTAVDTAVFDPVPPTLGPTTVAPASILSGGVVQFDGSATDSWSGPVSLHWDFGDGQTADGASFAHTFNLAGTFAPKLVATDSAGNSASATSQVLVAPVAPRGLARPVAGQTVNLDPIAGSVFVKVPGSGAFVPLVSPTQVIEGAIIDARKGRVRITIDNGRGGLDTAEFYGGIFRFTQPKVKPGQLWFANLYLYGGSFKSCPRAPRNPKVASLSKRSARKQQSQSERHLWGSGKGAFRTVGRFSSATVRGTTWLTDDRCGGTFTKVTTGKVGVRDFVVNRTIVLTKGKTYFAQPKSAKAAKKR